MTPGKARRRVGKTVYFMSNGKLLGATLVSVSDDGQFAELLIGDMIRLEVNVALLIP